MSSESEARRKELAATLEGRSDEEYLQGVQVQGVDTVLDQIFAGMQEAFLPEKAGSQSAVIQYDVNVSGKVHSYQLKVANGKCELVKGASGPARVMLGLGLADFLRLVSGKLNGMQAFMTGKLKLTGDMMFAQVMQGWFPAVSTLTVGPVELYYEEHGRGDPLLLVMGLAADSRAWMFQVPDFAEHYRTIVFDNRGVGRSAKPSGPYTIHEMADDAAGLLAALGIARAHVVGVSMGGMIAQELVLRHPERVRGLVLGCTYPEPDADIEQQREFSVRQLGGTVSTAGEVQIDLTTFNPLDFFQHLLPRVFNQSFIDSDLPRLMELFSGALEYGFSMEAILGQVAAAMGHKATDRLHRIAAPTLVITGDADLLIPPGNSDILARHIPNAKLIKVPGGSHAFNFETPAVFNKAVLDFLATVPA